jgi:hypothetical protein
MAKRRNQKKEKALRNLAYARKFRKRTNTGRFTRNRRYGSDGSAQGDSDEMDQDLNSDNTGAADT